MTCPPAENESPAAFALEAVEATLEPTAPQVALVGGGEKQTAKRAVQILTESGRGFIEPTRAERRTLGIAFAIAGKVLYGAAFDVIRVSRPVDLTDAGLTAAAIDAITVFEIKSTNKVSVREDFRGYFFDLTTAELLVAQSLGEQYRFAFVNTITRDHLELSLQEVFGRARKIYPKWAISF